MLINILKFFTYFDYDYEILPFRGTYLSDGKFRILDWYDRQTKHMLGRRRGQIITSCKTHQLIRICLIAKIRPPLVKFPDRNAIISKLANRSFATPEKLDGYSDDMLKYFYSYIMAPRDQLYRAIFTFFHEHNMIEYQ